VVAGRCRPCVGGDDGTVVAKHRRRAVASIGAVGTGVTSASVGSDISIGQRSTG
jgi:hypothetical protein